MTQTATKQQPQQTEEHEEQSDNAQLLDQVLDATTGTIDRRESAFIDRQLDVSLKRPRNVHDFIKKATEYACLDEQTAASCTYRVPRGGKQIVGPSVRLAEICAMTWRNIHVESAVSEIGDTHVKVIGTCWDMESNIRFATPVVRRITDRNNRRFNDDMIIVTINAASSIALRNAIFRIIPKALVESIRQKAEKTARGDEKSLSKRRAELLAYFKKLKVDEKRILAAVDKKGLEDIDLDDLSTLRGFATAIQDKEATVDECFPLDGGEPKTLLDKMKGSDPKNGTAAEEPPPTKADGEIIGEGKPEDLNALDALKDARQRVLDLKAEKQWTAHAIRDKVKAKLGSVSKNIDDFTMAECEAAIEALEAK